jgi:hypothetical protein
MQNNNDYLYNKKPESENLVECQYFESYIKKCYDSQKSKSGKQGRIEICDLTLTSSYRGTAVFYLQIGDVPAGLPNMTRRSLYNRGLLLHLKDGICPFCSGAMKSVKFEDSIEMGMIIENEVGCPSCKFSIIEAEDFTRE